MNQYNDETDHLAVRNTAIESWTAVEVNNMHQYDGETDHLAVRDAQQSNRMQRWE